MWNKGYFYIHLENIYKEAGSYFYWWTFVQNILLRYCKPGLIICVRRRKIESEKEFLRFFTKQSNPRSFGSRCVKGSGIQSGSGFFGSFDVPWSERSWIDLFIKEMQNPFRILLDLRTQSWIFLTEKRTLSCCILGRFSKRCKNYPT